MSIRNFKQVLAGVMLVLAVTEAQAENSAQPTTQAQALQQLQQLELMAASKQQNSSVPPISAGNTPGSFASSNNAPNNTNAFSAFSANSANANYTPNNPPNTVTPVPVAQTSTSSPSSTESSSEQASNAAFDMVTSRLFPLSTEQVVKLHALYNASELAKVTSPSTPPRPTATSQIVNLSTGSTPPVIRLGRGFVSSMVFLDSTGAPWPIVSYDVGDPQAFNIQWDKVGNTLMVQASTLYTYGNLAVRLQGLNTPVMLTLIPGQKAVDYRVDLRVQGYGPNAYPAQTQNLPPSANSILLTVLDGVSPPGSKLLDVTGGPAEVWEKEDRLYVRTRLKILSPGWISVMSSADGMNAYEMQKTPVLLVSWRGKVLELRVEGL